MHADVNDTMQLEREIATLLGSPAGGAGAPSLSTLEDTLTTGYARALALEAELERLERRLAAVDREDAAKLRDRLEDVELRLAGLRRILVPLRSRARAVRALEPSLD
jgi:hypothetical protein